jgi:hypothetical protein
MRRPEDPLTAEESARAGSEIEHLARERPELTQLEVTDLWMRARRHLLLAGEATSWRNIWGWVAAASPRSPDFRQRDIVLAEQEPPTVPVRRRRGRPPGSGELSVEILKKTYSDFEAKHRRRPTQEELASATDRSARTLRDYLKRHNLAWPLGE